MKLITFAIAAAMGAAGVAHAQTDPNGPNTPPGDGITRMGTNPEGQPYTPPGFNNGLNVYPAASSAQGMMPGMMNYPVCSREVTDRCVQGYTRMTRARRS